MKVTTTHEPEYGNDEACSNCGDEWSPLTMESGVLLCEDCYSEWVASEG